MNPSPEFGVVLALLCVPATTVAFLARHRGVTAARRLDPRRSVEAAARVLRLRWRAMQSVAHDEIVGELHRARTGDVALSPWLARFALDALSDAATSEPAAPIDPVPAAPTACEREVLLLIASGYAYEQVAARLEVSVTAVEGHVSSVLRKLGTAESEER
jgi:DNA-binding NarL/FixJ family response regulator